MAKPRRQRLLAGFEDDEAVFPGQAAVPTDEPAPVTATPLRPRSAREEDSSGADLAGKTVFVVDAHSLIYQVFHAMPEMSSPTGQPVGAVHGFIRDIVDILERKQPDYLVCAFDHPGETFRHALYERYKESRPSMPDDLRSQIGSIQRMLAAMGVPALSIPDYEADDILATVARRTERLGGKCILVTGDKDCRQLISENVQVYDIRKDEFFGVAELAAAWGIRPDQVVDFQALVGDSVDNIPGVPLIGPKIARELLVKYGSLENVLDHADEVSGKKRRENLRLGRRHAMLSRQLVRLVDDVPIEIDWAQARTGRLRPRQVAELCREFGFRRLADRLAGLEAGGAATVWHGQYRTVRDRAELEQLAAELGRQRRVAVDVVATSLSPRWGDIVGFAFAWKPGEGCYVSLGSSGPSRIDVEGARELLWPVFENPTILKTGHNLKYAAVVLRSHGCRLRGIHFDDMVSDYLLAPGERNHGLPDLSKRYLNHETAAVPSELVKQGEKESGAERELGRAAAEGADVALRLSSILQQQLEEQSLWDLFTTLEMPLVDVLAEMEFHGIKVDVARLTELGKQLEVRLARLQQEIYALGGGEFNIDSPKQLARVLFDELGLPVIKRTKTGPSTDVDVLTELARHHSLPAKIIAYRQDAKLKSTYIDALPALVHPHTGRVHSSFKQDVAATGRLSSTDPNLQNIPVRTETGRQIRSAFLPGEPGWLLLTADYSQIELRVLAHFSQDPALQKAFGEDIDIHRLVAGEVYNVPLDQVTGAMRRSAKAINFGVIYGLSPFGLAKTLDIEKGEAARFIEAYFAQYRGVGEFIKKVLEDCRQKGYVSTALGRRRPVLGVREAKRRGDSYQRNLPERIAVNTVIQGSAADLIKLSMIAVHRRMQREQLRARMLLQIHDELVFEVPSEEVECLSVLVNDEMTGVGQLTVPLKVDIKTGPNWAECG